MSVSCICISDRRFQAIGGHYYELSDQLDDRQPSRAPDESAAIEKINGLLAMIPSITRLSMMEGGPSDVGENNQCCRVGTCVPGHCPLILFPTSSIR
jgi:hypothetical protein